MSTLTLESILATAADHRRQLEELAEAEARDRLVAQQAEAEDAFGTFMLDTAIASEAAKEAQGYPGITTLLTGLSGILRSGRLPSEAPAPVSTPGGGANLQPEVDRLTGELATANAEVARLQGELANATDPAELTELTTRLSNLQSNYDSVKTEADRLTGELATANAEVARLQGELANATDPAELRRARVELAAARATLTGIMEGVERLPRLAGSTTVSGRHRKVPTASVRAANAATDELRRLLGLPELTDTEDNN